MSAHVLPALFVCGVWGWGGVWGVWVGGAEGLWADQVWMDQAGAFVGAVVACLAGKAAGWWLARQMSDEPANRANVMLGGLMARMVVGGALLGAHVLLAPMWMAAEGRSARVVAGIWSIVIYVVFMVLETRSAIVKGRAEPDD